MAKTKNKRNLSSKISAKKKSAGAAKLNPFELHINKEKMKVLGRSSKHTQGLPGVSRIRAIKKRKGTLLQEYNQLNKTNRFIDKRIGERNHDLTEEERNIARFTAVRAKAHKKQSIFNLADDEVLTHRGQTLNEIEKFDDPRSDDESDDGYDASGGKLTSDFVEDAHFGGGVLTRTSADGARSHKDLINQLIAESKKRKAEKQFAKEKTLQLTEQLDTDWKDLIPIINKSVKRPNEATKVDVDEYDKTIRELKFEARGHPSEPLKPQGQIAQEEKEKLEKLEAERVTRMKGLVEENVATRKHQSADDLDDCFAYEADSEVFVSYNDEGMLNMEHEDAAERVVDGKDEAGGSDDEADGSEAEAEGSGDGADGSEAEVDGSGDGADGSDAEADGPEAEAGGPEAESDASDAEAETEDDLSDLKNESSDSEDEPEATSEEKPDTDNPRTKQDVEKIKADLLKRKEMMENARKELPYTFTFPESYDSLKQLLESQSPEHQSVIIERIIKCTHPSLNEGNKEKLKVLFAYILQYINDLPIKTDIRTSFRIFSNLIPQLFDLAQLDKENAYSCMIEVIKEKHLEYRKHPKSYPAIDVLLFLKIVSCLFPTSDFRHRVVTPCFCFMDQMLMKCKPKTKKDIAYGLFLVTLALEFTSLSKRYLPAALSFLGGILHNAIPKSGIKLIKVTPPFRSTSSSLVLYKNCSSLKMSLKLESSDLLDAEISEDFKIRALHTCLKLIEEFKSNFKELSSRKELFCTILGYLKQIPSSNYPEDVQNEISGTVESLEAFVSDLKLNYIVMEAKRPKALRLYTPNIEKVYDFKKRKVQSREAADRSKLLHKIKKERKGALREIRKDRAFLGRVKINQKIRSDKERHDKVKRIFAEASIQQGELNALKRKKK